MFAFVLIELQAAIAAMVLDQMTKAVELLRGTGDPQRGGNVENSRYFSVSCLIACFYVKEKVRKD